MRRFVSKLSLLAFGRLQLYSTVKSPTSIFANFTDVQLQKLKRDMGINFKEQLDWKDKHFSTEELYVVNMCQTRTNPEVISKEFLKLLLKHQLPNSTYKMSVDFQVSVFSYLSLTNQLESIRRIANAVEFDKKVNVLDASVFPIIMYAFSHAAEVNMFKVFHFYEKARMMNKLSHPIICCWLRSYFEVKGYAKLINFYEENLRDTVEKSSTKEELCNYYSIIFAALGHTRMAKKITEYFQRMKDLELDPSEHHQLQVQLSRLGLNVDVENTLEHYSMKFDKWDSFHQEGKNLVSQQIGYMLESTHVLSAFEEFLKLMITKIQIPDISLGNKIIEKYISFDNFEKGIQIYNFMTTKNKPVIVPNLITFTGMLKGLYNAYQRRIKNAQSSPNLLYQHLNELLQHYVVVETLRKESNVQSNIHLSFLQFKIIGLFITKSTLSIVNHMLEQLVTYPDYSIEDKQKCFSNLINGVTSNVFEHEVLPEILRTVIDKNYTILLSITTNGSVLKSLSKDGNPNFDCFQQYVKFCVKNNMSVVIDHSRYDYAFGVANMQKLRNWLSSNSAKQQN